MSGSSTTVKRIAWTDGTKREYTFDTVGVSEGDRFKPDEPLLHVVGIGPRGGYRAVNLTHMTIKSARELSRDLALLANTAEEWYKENA